MDSIEIEFDGNVYAVEVENGGEEDAVYTFNDSEMEFGDILEQLSQITISEDQEAELSDNKEELALDVPSEYRREFYGRTGLLSVQWFLLHLCAERRRDQLCGQRVGRGSERGCKFCDPGYKL